MRWQKVVRVLLLLTISLILLADSVYADFGDLLQRIPGEANALVLIRADKVFTSPLATNLGWKMGLSAASADQPLIVPRGTRRLVVGTQLNLASMEPVWEFAVVDMKKAPSMKVVTRIDGGYIDRLSGLQAAWTPMNTYFVKFSDHLVGAIFPADRQRASRWIKQGKTAKGGSLSPYLEYGAAFADKGADIVMVLDLEHATSARDVGRRIESFDAVAGKEDQLEAFCGVLANIRGITLRVDVGDSPHGKVTIHFNDDASPLEDVARPMFLEALARNGAMIDDIADWKATVSSTGKTITLEGELTTHGMRRLLSLAELPMPSDSAGEERGDAKATSPGALRAEASRKYFKAVSALLADLRERREGTTLGHTDGLWIGRYARKVYRLPILNVDEDLQEYGAEVAARLLQAVDVIEGHRQEAKARAAGVSGGGKYYGGRRFARTYGSRRGGYHSDAADARQQNRDRQQQVTADRIKRINERKRIRTEELSKGTVAAREIIDGIRNLTISIRKEMTNRYNVEF